MSFKCCCAALESAVMKFRSLASAVTVTALLPVALVAHAPQALAAPCTPYSKSGSFTSKPSASGPAGGSSLGGLSALFSLSLIHI